MVALAATGCSIDCSSRDCPWYVHILKFRTYSNAILACFLGEMWISRFMGPKQGIWVTAVQRRVATTSSFLRSIKAVKMAGLVDSMGKLLQNERVRELELAKGFRWLIVWLNVLG